MRTIKRRRWSDCVACSNGYMSTVDWNPDGWCRHEHEQALLTCGDPTGGPTFKRQLKMWPWARPNVFSCDVRMVPFIEWSCAQGWYPWVSCEGGEYSKAYVSYFDQEHGTAALAALPLTAYADNPPNWPFENFCIRIPTLDMREWKVPA